MTGGRVLHVCCSALKGQPKREVPSAVLETDHGIAGDAHAGPGHRQVSMLAAEDIESIRAKGLELAPGAFGENLVVTGVDLGTLAPGRR